MLQQAIVGVIVVLAMIAIAKRYLPAIFRRWSRRQAAAMARKCGALRIAATLERALSKEPACGSGCSSCGGCSSGAPDKKHAIRLDVLRREMRR